MRGEEFYIVLPSNSSMLYFPENKTTQFTTELPQRIDLHGRWEVALTEIQFPCSFLHIRPGEGLITFVDIKENDKTMTVKKSRVLSGVYSTVDDIIAAVNLAARSAFAHIVWQFSAITGGKVIMRLTCEKEKCNLTHYVTFSDKLSRILGFDIRNKHGDSSELDSDLLLATPDYLPAKLYRKANYTQAIRGDISVKINDSSLKVSDDDEIYTTVFYKLEHKAGIISNEPASLLRSIPDKLFVYCDICEPYIIGDVQSPLLRIVANDTRNDYAFASTRIKHFSPAQYVSLRQLCFRTIEIDIRDQLGESIPFEFGTLTVTLHFRRIE